MIRSLDAILIEINSYIAQKYTNEVLYELAVLQPDEYNKTFPMTRQDSEQGIQISPNDQDGLVFYHRLLSPVEVKPLDGAKGLKNYQLALFNLRLVGVGYRNNITSSNNWNNQDIANDVMRILGRNTQLANKETLQVNGRVITDKREVLNIEFAENDIDHRTLDLIAFSIDYTIQQKQICAGPNDEVGDFVAALVLTQAEYDAITPDSNTYYIICDS